MYKRWQPGSRRHRRRNRGSSGRSGAQGTDRVVFLVIGAFVSLMVIALVLAFIAMRFGG